MPGPGYMVCDCGKGGYAEDFRGHACEASRRKDEFLAKLCCPLPTPVEMLQYDCMLPDGAFPKPSE